ncbi:MAG: Crp/Fnr family transcriptional regulator [Methylococcales bacterium]|nr:Crp/Fnr family transcriptional regulator [Methylococcales bacterium]MDD5753361.1 Crp/Fnr family transcriptional regulator [Methylococcales bacterium]
MQPVIKVKAGTVVFKEGSLDRTMFIVLEGIVKIYVERHEEEIELAIINKNDFFGEMAIYRSRPRSASAKVMKDARLVVIKNRIQLEQFIGENPTFAGKMMVIMGNRLANTNDLLLEKIDELATKSAEFSGDEELERKTSIRVGTQHIRPNN